MKKILLMILAIFMLISCFSSETASDNNVTIFSIHNAKALDPSWPVFKEAEKLTGIKLENVASQNQTDELQSFNLMIASTPLPDLIGFGNLTRLEELGLQGGVIPLEELIEEHAPNIKKFFEENPRYKKDATAVDGHIYAIPNYYDYYNLKTSMGYFIRKDWLKKLNLKEPTTIDELYNVLKAFKEKDPNENGKNDEVPFFARGATSEVIMQALIDMFKTNLYWIDVNGSAVYGPSTTEFKQAMITLSKWYKEGLIDKEIFTRGMKARDYMLTNNLGGMTSDWIASTSSYNESLTDKIKGFDFGIVLPPIVNGNNKTFYNRGTNEGAISISKDAKDPVKLIKWLDFWYTEEGRRLWNFGIENEDYVMKDGNPVFTDKVLKNKDAKTPLQVLREQGAQYRLGAFQDHRYELGWASEEAKKNINIYMEADVITESMPSLKFTPDELSQVVKINSDMLQFVLEKSQEWILGTSDVNKDWDMYINRLNEIGMKKLEKIETEALHRYNK